MGRTPVDHYPKAFSFASRHKQTRSYHGTVEGYVGEERGGRGCQSVHSGFLQQVLRDPKERTREMEVNLGHEFTRADLYSQTGIQDGNCGRCEVHFKTGGVGCLPGLYGCVLPRSHPQEFEEVPQVLHLGPCVSVPGSTNGSLHFGKDFHSPHQSSEGVCSEEGDLATSIHRRLVSSRAGPFDSRYAYEACEEDSRKLRICGELKKVRVGSGTAVRVPRTSVQSGDRVSNFVGGQMDEVDKITGSVSAESQSESNCMAKSDRKNGVISTSSQAGNSKFKTNSDGFQRSMESEDRFSTGDSNFVERACSDSEMVVQQRQYNERCTLQERKALSPALHRRVPLGLGRLCQSDGFSERGLVRSGEGSAYQPSRNASSLENARSLQTVGIKQGGADCLRQFNNSELSTKGRRHSVKTVTRTHDQSVQVGGASWDNSEVPAHSREVKCDGRCFVKGRSDPANGMDDGSLGSKGPVVVLGPTKHRLVRHTIQQSDELFCVPDSRPTSNVSGCSLNRLEGDVCIRFPSNSHSEASAQEDSGGKLCHNSDSPLLAQASMVSRNSESLDRLSSSVTVQEEFTETAQIESVPSVARETEPTCMEIIRDSLLKRGFSREVAERMSKPFKDSSANVYESKWKGFCDWCSSRNTDPCKAPLSVIAEFLNYLHVHKKLSSSTIAGYRTAIGKVLKVTQNMDIGNDQGLTDLLHNFERDISVKKDKLMNWNLAFVLKTLSGSPFEPLHLADLKYMTFKTIFLLALATGARRSELHALRSDSIQTQESSGSLVLHTDVNFIAKTQLVNQGGDICQPIVVKALTRFVGPQDEERVLCPVRAVKSYLRRTKDIRGDRKRLFIAYKKGHRHDIVKSTVSGWVKKTVVCCYQLSSSQVRDFHGVKAHQVRSLAASWALHKNCPLEKILAACSWKSHATFTNYYLRDLTLEKDGMRQLGPLIVAKQLV